MRWPWKKQEVVIDLNLLEMYCTSQNSLLQLAQVALAIANDPDLVDDELREQLRLLVEEVGDGIAILQEYVVV